MDGKRGPTRPPGFDKNRRPYISVEGEQFNRALAEVISRYRQESGYTLVQLSELTDIKRTVLCRLGLGRREIRFEYVIRICMALGKPVEQAVKDARLLAFPDGLPDGRVTLRYSAPPDYVDLDDERDEEPESSFTLTGAPCPW